GAARSLRGDDHGCRRTLPPGQPVVRLDEGHGALALIGEGASLRVSPVVSADSCGLACSTRGWDPYRPVTDSCATRAQPWRALVRSQASDALALRHLQPRFRLRAGRRSVARDWRTRRRARAGRQVTGAPWRHG